MNEAYLMHYGVKGMKWGVRKDRSKSYSDDYNSTKSLRKKNVKQLSNSELRKLNERMQLEANYKRLNPSVVNKGYKFAKGLLTAGGTIGGLYQLSKSEWFKQGRQYVKNRFS